jgi:hypothetical protein
MYRTQVFQTWLGGVQSRIVSCLCLYIAGNCVICAITNPDNRTSDITAGSYIHECVWRQSFSHLATCNGSFWSESTVSNGPLAVTIYCCTSRDNPVCGLRVYADQLRPFTTDYLQCPSQITPFGLSTFALTTPAISPTQNLTTLSLTILARTAPLWLTIP